MVSDYGEKKRNTITKIKILKEDYKGYLRQIEQKEKKFEKILDQIREGKELIIGISNLLTRLEIVLEEDVLDE